MYLAEIKLWNFRKYSSASDELDLNAPHFRLFLKNGLNVIVGENNAGKTAIVDAIRYVLGTQSREYLRPVINDFSSNRKKNMNKMRIEAIMKGITEQEAGLFLDWLEFEEAGKEQIYILRISLIAEIRNQNVVYRIEAGPANSGKIIDGEVRDLLRVTYLKPLRDADAELTPGRRSRLAQILSSHSLFLPSTEPHPLEILLKKTNTEIENYFSKEKGGAGQEILTTINQYLENFSVASSNPCSTISISGSSLSDILHRLELGLGDIPEGLGSLNLLYIATELLLLQETSPVGLHLGIIEELEAHLHPQAQLRLISFLENKTENCQFILTSHSTTIGSSVDLKNIIICKNNNAFSLNPKYTKLEPKHYDFLRRFLDATKANLFFANGLIFVEGDAENILLPTIAKFIKRPLHKYGISIINVGSLAFAHYAKIFERQNNTEDMGMKISIITDRDIRPLEYYEKNPTAISDTAPSREEIDEQIKRREICLSDFKCSHTKVFMSSYWTLEYEIALSSFRKILYKSILWARKIQNSTSGYPKKEKLPEIQSKCGYDFYNWKKEYSNQERKNEKIAYNIYQPLLDKNVSKAITAQVFVDKLETIAKKSPQKQEQVCRRILESPTLKYLVDAIAYVTEPF